MKLKYKEVILEGADDRISLKRNDHGIPVIRATSFTDLAFGLGWIHASDRQLQTLLTRILLKGQAAEHLKGSAELIAVDQYMRTMNFLPDPQQEVAKLEHDVKEQLEAYARGFNYYLFNNRLVYEFKLLGYKPDPWDIIDTLVLGKVIGFIGLAEAQGNMEKFLLQMIQHDFKEDKLRELFPYLTEEIDYELCKKVKLAPALIPESLKWLGKLPRFIASNNWAVSGTHTFSGKPILCGDPHLEVNRLPSVWQEIVMILPDNKLTGISIPGAPGLILGRTSNIAWSATYSFMDMLDYRIEYCRNGKYKRDDGWKDFVLRQEVIQVKKGQPLTLKVYENEHGMLEGDPYEEGYYLVLGWSASNNCGANDLNGILNLAKARSVKEAMELFKMFDASSLNYVIADTQGNIGYQMSGRQFNRPAGVSGLMPLPGWVHKYDSNGFIDKDKLPALYNPDDGIIVTANQDLNYLGKSNPINLAMGAYRAERIKALLSRKQGLTVDDMKNIHYDLYSLQAQSLMEIIRPLLPDTPNGRILKEWDLCYEKDSTGAMLFESIYLALIRVVFGDNALGRDVVDFILKETSLFNDYYANLDAILLKEESAWFEGKKRDDLFNQAICEGLNVVPRPYGKTRQIMLRHLLFGEQLPRFLGYDYGPIELPGCRATIPQGQIFTSAGRTTTFSPSYRFIADMAGSELHSNIPGGPTDRRFSRWYTTDIQNWLDGVYKVLD